MRNKLLLTTFIFLTTLNAFAKESKFTIIGKITDADSGTLFIRNLIKMSVDTVKFTKGEFKYTGMISDPTPHVIADDKNRYQMFFADPGSNIKITLKRNEMQLTSIEGSASQEIFKKLIMAQDPLQQIMAKVQQEMAKQDANHDSLQEVMILISNQRNANFYQFIKENGSTEVAAFIVFSSITNERSIDAKMADSMYSFLSGKAITNFYGKETLKAITKLRAVSVGYIAPDFTLPDSTGKKNYTLSKLRNNYLLVDFWASWCGPCKGEIPFMKEAYAKFHSKGFEIMSVSLDDKRDNWLNALRQFQMPWIQVSDVKGFKSTVNDLYPIPSIPKTLLLDKTGKIIATDLRGPALDMKLKEILGSE